MRRASATSLSADCTAALKRRRAIANLVPMLLLSSCATAGPISFSCPAFTEAEDGGPYAISLPPTALERQIQGDVLPNPPAAGGDALIALSLPGASPAVPAPSNTLTAIIEKRIMIEAAGQAPPARGILLLSGGGQWGAFGAGYLRELANRGQLPRFEAITGVSTGALQAIFVGAAQGGDTQAYDALTTAYSPKVEKEIVDRHAFILAALYGSVAGLKPLRRRVETALCADVSKACMIDTLAKLPVPVLLGFVEADSGKFTYVDATAIARSASRKVARDCITGAALASAGMPVFLQQVRVGGRTYYDGGVRESVFLAQVASAAREAVDNRTLFFASQKGMKRPSITVPLYIIRNGPTIVDPIDPGSQSGPDRKADPLTAAQRAEPIIVNQVEVGSIAALRLADPEGPILLVTADGWNGATPAGGACKKPPTIMFDPSFMACLQRYGAQKADRDAPYQWISLRRVSDPPAPSPAAGRTQ